MNCPTLHNFRVNCCQLTFFHVLFLKKTFWRILVRFVRLLITLFYTSNDIFPFNFQMAEDIQISTFEQFSFIRQFILQHIYSNTDHLVSW